MSLSRDARTILAVDLDYFYAQCEEVRKPEIKDKPVVICVFSGRTEDSGAVSTSNYVARRLGVKSGIPIILAKRILSKNIDAVFLPMDRDYYDAVSERIMEILRSHSQKMEQMSVDEAYLDVTEYTRGDYSSAEKIASTIKRRILEAEHFTCSVGIGPNKLVAKMAVDAKKPDGLTMILPDQVRSFLDPLPVGKLFGVGPKTEEKLGAMGIKIVKDLANCDEARLSSIFGKNLGPQLKLSAQGIDDDIVQEREQEQLSRIVTLKQDARAFNFEYELAPLCRDISERLAAKKLLCKSVGIIAITTDLKTKNRARTLDAPTSSEAKFMEVGSELFNSFFDENEGIGVRRAGIRVSNLIKAADSQMKNPTLAEFFG
ncbi:MAG TPA: DNA polymerase IV [Nitrososphaerales archaeon]|nr:DNA polymerase IV [Nitrososphaerales archaeon]